MGFFEKLGLVEREVDLVVPVVPEVVAEPKIEVDAEINSSANVVEEIYAQNGLSDRSNSIYTVQALIDTLPDEMTTAKKQSTVSGILMVSGKSVTDLLNDAQNRIDILCAARDKIVGDRNDEIAVASTDIEALKQAIEAATIKIKEAENIISATKDSVGDEINAIDNLVKFCEGMNK
jgi:hypothetical protein